MVALTTLPHKTAILQFPAARHPPPPLARFALLWIFRWCFPRLHRVWDLSGCIAGGNTIPCLMVFRLPCSRGSLQGPKYLCLPFNQELSVKGYATYVESHALGVVAGYNLPRTYSSSAGKGVLPVVGLQNKLLQFFPIFMFLQTVPAARRCTNGVARVLVCWVTIFVDSYTPLLCCIFVCARQRRVAVMVWRVLINHRRALTRAIPAALSKPIFTVRTVTSCVCLDTSLQTPMTHRHLKAARFLHRVYKTQNAIYSTHFYGTRPRCSVAGTPTFSSPDKTSLPTRPL